MDWRKNFLKLQHEYQPSSYLIGLSGGRDSVALLHSLMAIELNAPLIACYVNHGWSELGEIWGDFCQNFAKKYGICCEVAHLNLSANGNAESEARKARYHIFAEMLPPKGVLLTAHHQDDQAETFMLQLMRGSGLNGLAAMPTRKKFAGGEHWRPFLNVSREEINHYINMNSLEFVDDPSNENLKYQRNLWRNEIIPAISKHYPHFSRSTARSVNHLAIALQLQQELIFSLLKDQKTFPFKQFSQQFSDKLVKTLLREWLRLQNASMPPYARLEAFNAAGNAELVWDRWHLQHYRGELFLYSRIEIAAPPKLKNMVEWSGIGKIFVENAPPNARFALYPQAVSFHEKNSIYKTSIKNFFQNKGINPFLRRRLPLLICERECLWIGGFGSAQNWQNLRVQWLKE